MMRALPPSRAALLLSIVLPLALLALWPPSRAEGATGRLLVLLEGTLATPIPPTLVVKGAGGEQSLVLGAIQAAAGQLAFEDLAPGAYRVGLSQGPTGDPDENAVEAGVHEGRTTLLHLDLSTGEITIDPFRPDPFGVDDAWDDGTLARMPGSGEDAARRAETVPAPPRQTRVEDFQATGAGFRYPSSVGGESMARSVSVPIGTAPATDEGPARSILARTAGAYADFEGATGDRGRTSWEGAIHRSLPSVPLSPRGFLSFRALQYLDGAPSVLENGRLPHNGLESFELLTRLDASPSRNTDLTALFYGEGNVRRYFLEAYRFNDSHGPREERAAVQGALRATHALSPGLRLVGEVMLHRTFLESGDGVFFDDLKAYGRQGNAPADASGLYWLPGHVYDHFFRKVQLETTTRLEIWKNPGTTKRVGAGVWARRGTYRSFEHLRPTLSYLGEGGGGYNLAQSIGYDLSGTSHADADGSEPGRPFSGGAFATLRHGLAGGEVEAGVRGTFYRSGQKPLRDLTHPVNEAGNLDADSFGKEKTHGSVDPRVGFTRAVGPRIRFWLTGGSETWIPPADATSFSATFLERMAATVNPGEPLRLIFGNPALKPERAWVGLAAVGATLHPRLHVRVGLEGRQIQDAITARSVPVDEDSLVYYVNDGVRDLVDLSVRASWEPSRYLRTRASYDLSEARTETVEPTLLDVARYAANLPTRGENFDEGLPFVLPAYDDGRDRGFYPSLEDRRHRMSLALDLRTHRSWAGSLAGTPLEDLEIGVLVRAASGAPFTWTQIYPAGQLDAAAPLNATGQLRNDGRLPWTAALDLRLARTMRLLGVDAQVWAEVLNLLDRENVVRVYQATGEADDDGWLDSAEGRAAVVRNGTDFAEAYRSRIDDLTNYGQPRLFRIGLRLRLQ